ncbi:hypothetical protein Tco_1125598 [Tanacetum coccineum]|uniref:Uncharacterized protein n=1 Tax=Tanacetum coccineum TaxID=301880 RepID=A0ABQ5JCF2_9ASTR
MIIMPVQKVGIRLIQACSSESWVHNIGNQKWQNGVQILEWTCWFACNGLRAEEFDLMATASDLDEIEEVNANCILMANLQQTSTSGTQTDNEPVYESGQYQLRKEKYVPNKVRARVRTRTPITVSPPQSFTKKDINSDSNGLSSIGVDNAAKTRRPQPRSNTKNDRVPS